MKKKVVIACFLVIALCIAAAMAGYYRQQPNKMSAEVTIVDGEMFLKIIPPPSGEYLEPLLQEFRKVPQTPKMEIWRAPSPESSPWPWDENYEPWEQVL